MAKKGKKNKPTPENMPIIHPHAAGIDVGAEEHWVCVPADRDAQPIQKFSAFTCDLHRLADWLTTCRVTTVVMESTGVYWIPLFQILEARGFEVALVNARHVKNVPGRPKTDRFDCRWLQKLHTYGLLAPSFRPPEAICQLRSLLRHRDNLIQMTVKHIQHMQKALDQMNLHLHHVISDITGVTGLRILRAIVAGERDPHTLATYRDYRIKSSEGTIAKALEGDYRAEHVFTLTQSLALHDFTHTQIAACDQEIERVLGTFDSLVDLSFSLPLLSHLPLSLSFIFSFHFVSIPYFYISLPFVVSANLSPDSFTHTPLFPLLHTPFPSQSTSSFAISLPSPLSTAILTATSLLYILTSLQSFSHIHTSSFTLHPNLSHLNTLSHYTTISYTS